MFRSTDPAPGESFALLHPRGTAFSPLWHEHAHFELNHVIAGRGVRWVGTRAERFAEGEIVLVPPNLPHSWNSDAGADGSAVEAVVAMFGPELLGGSAGPPEWSGARALLDDAGDGLAFEDRDGTIGSLLRRMIDDSPSRRLLGLLGVLDLLAQAPRHRLSGGAHGDAAGASDLVLVRKALRRLRDPASPSMRQIDLARDFAVSPSRLSRAFRRVTGDTYATHVNTLRIARACTLLQRGDLSVAQVCFEAGYGNLSNFNRRFKAIVARTPQAYRRAFRASMADRSA